MAQGIRLHVWGDLACFTRPEMKVERVSYDVMTPSAARGILEAIHWKPAIRWRVMRIHVLRPIVFRSIRRNEVTLKASTSTAKSKMKLGTTAGLGIDASDSSVRAQRAALVLTGQEVAAEGGRRWMPLEYIIEARFDLTRRAAEDDTAAKHISMFNRRAEQGQCFHRPCLGTREFPAEFRLLADGETPASTLPDADKNKDLGWMTYEPGYPDAGPARFFHARLEDGVLEVDRLAGEGLVS